ncbi:hypothetical protein CHLNCDRAFT_142306 [Chlorella variabilis]|uniref:Pectate lyase superfamily protein domain-containing protein n=1 Tax=Chlorella variabilis TaxID=554065 RepID=E1Z894_CHLVA|nr:hypothetical protein CHLNCDRAFT_142306 [Chlorella variabilis]EFN58054.1 hypothetical protein CHLNCDRAFT_142306 [Chlorella variabilis]|eukprot:XP_005850156.1 hypothetical protein CHLNCDRAFT_142306 [Chlorella variabilis]
MARRITGAAPPPRLLLLLAAVVAAAQWAPSAAAQTCGNIDALGPGRASGKGVKNDAPALAAMDSNPSVGLIYLPRGRYRISSSLSLRKPVLGEQGAVFQVEGGATLTLQSQPEYGLWRLFDVRAGGKVAFGIDTVRVFPEWFGAVGSGKVDDAPAIQAAFDTAASSGAAMLYLSNAKYGIGREVTFTNAANVMSEPDARFGGYSFKNVLPHLSGFADFCLRLFGADLGSFQLKTLANCGDAIRLEAQPPKEGDIGTVLDNTIWFDTITNSRNGIAYRAGEGCGGDACIFQGNQVLGSAITGCAASGQTAAMAFFFSAKPMPAWDSNQFNIATVTPCKTNTAYALLYADPRTETAREVVRIGSVGAVAPGATLFSGRHIVLQASINLREQQPDGAGALRGLASMVEFSGQTNPLLASTPIKAATRPRSKSLFNGGKSLLANYFTIRAVPELDWLPGESQTFYVYHQMATGELYNIKCDAPKLKSTGLPLVSCLQVRDNAGGGAKDEIQVTLINLTGQTMVAGSQQITFTMAVATLGSP